MISLLQAAGKLATWKTSGLASTGYYICWLRYIQSFVCLWDSLVIPDTSKETTEDTNW